LRAPTPRPEQLVRTRLLELLGEAVERKVSLISAPAGYGKSTLLAQWLQAQDASLAFAWISLDEQDNDPVRMWRHIVEALHRVAPEEEGFGADVLVGMSAVGNELVEIVFPMLINELAELPLNAVEQKLVQLALPMLINELAELPHRVVVVLDDYQLITEGECHESVAFFVEHLPANVHLVLSSRIDPPLALGRWRARGEMMEIRTEQLAFSEEEAAYVLNEVMSLDIGSGDISVLFEHTEGWPAGIYLAALCLQGRDDKQAFIASFGGANRYIVDLMGEEVLAGLPEEEREFLQVTSVLRRMTGSLCDAVVDREGSGQLLRKLTRSNLFVIPLGEEGEWYRYHHLFSEFLLDKLKSSRPDLVTILHERASAWSEGRGFFEGAVRHAIAATDYERAGMLVAHHWFGYVAAGQSATVERWLESLPEELTTHDAPLLLVRAWICALSGRREETENLLDLVQSIPHEGPLPDRTASVEAGVATIRAIFGFGGVQHMVEATRRAVALEGARTSPWTATIRFGLGSGSFLSGETSLARKQFEEALELIGAGRPLSRMVTLAYLSIVAADEGHLQEAESLAREAHALVERFGLQEVPQSSWVPIALGYMLAKRGRLAEAQSELESSLSVRRRLPGLSPWPTLIGLAALAQVYVARGDRDGARAMLAEARAMLERYPDAGILSELLERLERKLRTPKSPKGQLDDELTERELEVLRLFDGELSTQQIAHRLYIAPSTVRTYIKSIHRKLGVSSRKEAVKQAHSRGLL
jgi:LuxR family maltose regulon positive regulatory protein